MYVMLENNTITPDEHTLQPDYEINCKFPQCKASYRNAGQYYMHCLRRHGHEEDANDMLSCCYYCPVPHCTHNQQNGNNSFAKLRYLRQHYRKVHAARKFNCTTCKKSFVTAKDLDTHLNKECGQKFICSHCKIEYNSSAALLTHAKRKQHEIKSNKPLIKARKRKEKHIAIQTDTPTASKATQTTDCLSGLTVAPVANNFTQTPSEILHDLSLTESLLDVFDPVQMSQWTQTGDIEAAEAAIFNDQCLADTQTQTCWPAVENDLGVGLPLSTDDLDAFVSTETQTSFTQCLFDAATSTADIDIDPTHSFDPLYMSQWTQTCESFLDSLMDVQNSTFMNNAL